MTQQKPKPKCFWFCPYIELVKEKRIAKCNNPRSRNYKKAIAFERDPKDADYCETLYNHIKFKAWILKTSLELYRPYLKEMEKKLKKLE